MGNGTVLLLGLGQLLLSTERLVALLDVDFVSLAILLLRPRTPPMISKGISRARQNSTPREQHSQQSGGIVATYRHFDDVVEVSESLVDVVMFLDWDGFE